MLTICDGVSPLSFSNDVDQTSFSIALTGKGEERLRTGAMCSVPAGQGDPAANAP